MAASVNRGGPICPHDETHGTIWLLDGAFFCSHSGHSPKGGGGPCLWDRHTMEPLRYSDAQAQEDARRALLPKTDGTVTPRPEIPGYEDDLLRDVPVAAPRIQWSPPVVSRGRGRPKGHPGNKKLAEMGLTFDQYRAKMGL